MTPLVYRRNTCRLCGGRDLDLVLQLAPTPSGDAYVSAERLGEVQETYPLDLVLCRGCSHAQLFDVVNPELLYGAYTYSTSISLGLAEHFRQYADAVLRYVSPPPGALVVDVGSNDGTLLKVFHDRGMHVLGVDPAFEVARKATASGIETLPTYFTATVAHKIKKERGCAAIVTANNVFANIDNLADMIGSIRDLLAPDGVFVFETSYLADVIQKALLETFFHEHLSYFSVKPLEAFFHRYGMELIFVERVPTKGGSVRGIVQRAGGPRKTSASVAQLVAYETSLGLDRVEPFKAFASEIQAVKTRLFGLLGGLKERGKTIAGYGASVGVTTLMYHFDLRGVLDFLVDDNASRHHLFSPGHHLPVLPARVIGERKPDYIVILAWAYADPIMKKNQAYMDQGGHFVVPLPKVTVL